MVSSRVNSPFFFQNKDDVEQRDASVFRPGNRRWNYKQTYYFIFKYYNRKNNWPE